MVELPCRALAQAARWNGKAPQTTTGAARVSESHCQYSNCQAGTIASATTGTDNTAETSSRCRSDRVSASSGVAGSSSSSGGAGTRAV